MSKEINIITVYDTINCGSFLQAWALKIALSDMGCKVAFQKSSLTHRMHLFVQQEKAMVKTAITGDFATLKNRHKMYKCFHLLQKGLTLVSKADGRTIVIGSDTLCMKYIIFSTMIL